MKQCYRLNSPVSLFVFLFILTYAPNIAFAQATYQPYSYQFYQKLNRVQYSPHTKQHTSIKPYILDSVIRPRYDSLMNLEAREQNTWLGRKIFNEHLIDIQNEEYTFYADFIPDFQIGRDFANNGKTTWLNTRGYQVGGTIQNKFFFYSSGYENQGVFPNYINDFINENQVVPGQMFGKLGSKEQDWTYVTAIASYSPNKNLNLSLAYDKNFIGDGYRSMLLSDVSSNSTSFKANGTLGDLNILSIWSYMIDPQSTEIDHIRSSSLRKYGAFHYVDWNVDNHFSVGLFHSLLWGKKLEPASSQSSTTMQLGLNTKYKILENISLYGQFIVNEEWAAQIGFRGFDAFGVKDLNFLGEYNFAKPYSYSSDNPLTNYSNYSQPLAHPFGANFKEAVSLINYSFKRFDFSFQANYGFYGLDQNSTDNYGKDIFKSINKSSNDSKIGQGLETNLVYLDAKIAYIINPKYNLRIETGAAFRSENNSMWNNKSGLITFGIRSSFRNLYYDF